ncbi:ABC transporter ATP-binding protein [Ensifer sp. 4252]|uniref:ABC transporter ATP-binding protein n=1 Tax=Ensifer sp. 4252 TaxID=3373915 RepID=UPI003D1CB426
MTNCFVNFKNVGKTYDGKSQAVRHLDLEIQEGEFLTFLGPSGSGKTTTLMMLAGFEQPTNGEIYVHGVPVTRTPPNKRNFGMVFQNYALFPHMSILDNVAFPLTVRGIGKNDARAQAESALDLVQLHSFANRRPAQLSGGQQQRAALARALVFEPTLVLLDEPLGALDTRLRVQMQMEIKHLHARLGNTMVSVTHDQTEALTMSDRIAVFNGGQIQQIATPTELYEKPKNSFVARFVGETNRLHGTVREVRRDTCAIAIDGGQTVIATRSSLNVGDRTTLSIRPERLHVLDAAAGSIGNDYPATIEETIYCGDHVRFRIKILDRTDWIVKVADRSVIQQIESTRALRIGWRVEDCLALDHLPDDMPSTTPKAQKTQKPSANYPEAAVA